MSRTVTRTVHAKRRNSKTAEKGNSPFRKGTPASRLAAAQVMVDKRRRELVALRALADEASDSHERRQLSNRIGATQASMRSWVTYIEKNTPLVPAATVRP